MLLLEDREHVAREAEHGVDRLAAGAGHVRDGVKDLKDQRHAVDDPDFFAFEIDDFLGFERNVVRRQAVEIVRCQDRRSIRPASVRPVAIAPAPGGSRGFCSAAVVGASNPGLPAGASRGRDGGIVEAGEQRLLIVFFRSFGHYIVNSGEGEDLSRTNVSRETFVQAALAL